MISRRTYRLAQFAVVASIAFASGCKLDDAGDTNAEPSDETSGVTYTLSPTQCKVNATLAIAGQTSSTYNACLMHFDERSRIVTWQLLPNNVTTSLSSPGPGVIVLSFHSSAAENATFQLARVVSPLPAQVDTNEVVFAFGSSSGRQGGTGTVDVGANFVDPSGGGGDLSGALDVKLTNGETLTGTFTASARAAASGGTSGGSSGGGGGGGGTGSGGKNCFASSQCNGYAGQCERGGQGACYCAAACLCAAACDTKCQASNSASARSTNTPCPY